MFESLQQRHDQFQAQARWTESIRAYLIERSELTPNQRCLEVGCGTGVLLQEWEHLIQPAWGIDNHFASLKFASTTVQSRLSAADVHWLPFAENTFDCIFSHYFFLWVSDPAQALQEIKRCLKPGGWLLAFAEPDYDGRIDFPPGLYMLRDIQIKALQKQGADPLIGRKLKSLLKTGTFQNISGGVLGSEWQETHYADITQNMDTQNLLYDLSISGIEMDPAQIVALDQKARLDGSRITYVPTFFYSAQK